MDQIDPALCKLGYSSDPVVATEGQPVDVSGWLVAFDGLLGGLLWAVGTMGGGVAAASWVLHNATMSLDVLLVAAFLVVGALCAGFTLGGAAAVQSSRRGHSLLRWVLHPSAPDRSAPGVSYGGVGLWYLIGLVGAQISLLAMALEDRDGRAPCIVLALLVAVITVRIGRGIHRNMTTDVGS